MEVKLYAIIILALDRYKQLTSRPGRFNVREKLPAPTGIEAA
jgi:hypothetical protein